MNVSPGLEVMWTTIWSDSTLVPPVTAERSPPDSRMTGADSPVMADSSTEATPSMTSPSPGMNSPAVTTTTSPERSFELATASTEPSARRRLAWVSARALRRVSACALPRPSAMASAKFAKSTVNHSQRVICKPKKNEPLCWTVSRMSTTRVMTAPTSTTNITGFLIIMRGFSFQKESTIALRSILPSANELLFAWGAGVIGPSKTLSGVHQQVFQNWAEAQGREEGERAHNKDDADEQDGEQRAGDWKSAQRFRDMFLRRQ